MPIRAAALVRRLSLNPRLPEPSGAPPDSAGRPAEFIASRLRRLMQRQAEATVVSFGCGDGRELELLRLRDERRLKFWAVAPEAGGLQIVAARAGPGAEVHLIDKPVLRVTAVDCPRADLVYSFGLLESLNDGKAARAMRIMAAQVRPGGEVIAGNWCPGPGTAAAGPRSRRMIPRPAAAMRRLADLAFPAQLWTRSIVQVGAFTYVRAKRLAY
jgi:SAM-dependent methyltransferase